MGAEVFDEGFVAGDKAAYGAEGFGHAAADDVHLVGDAEVVGGAAALAAEDAEAVGVVEHGEHFVGGGGFEEGGEGGDVAFHRVDAFDGEEFGGVAGELGGDVAEIGGVVVGEAFEGGGGEAGAVPHAGVDVFIGEDDVALLREGGEAGEAGEVAGGVDLAGFFAEEGGEFGFEGEVVGAGAVGDAGAGGAGAPFEEGGAGGLDGFGVEGEAEVVVAGEHDHVAAVEADAGALLPLGGVVVGGVAEAELGGGVVAAAVGDRVLAFREEGKGHVVEAVKWVNRPQKGKSLSGGGRGCDKKWSHTNHRNDSV